MIYTLEDLERAFEAGSHWKEKYSKTVGDDIQVPDFEKFVETPYMRARKQLPLPHWGSENYVPIRVPEIEKAEISMKEAVKESATFLVFAFERVEFIDQFKNHVFAYKHSPR